MQFDGSNTGGWLGIAFIGGLYFLPTIVAAIRRHHQENAIFLLNLLLGWTLIGWVAAIIWAATYTPGRPRRPPRINRP